MITPFVRRKEFASTKVRVPGGVDSKSRGRAKGIPSAKGALSMMTCVADEKPLLANPTSSPLTVPVALVNENGIVTACAGRTIKTAAAIATGIKNLFILNPRQPATSPDAKARIDRHS